MTSENSEDSYWTKRRKIIAKVNKHFTNKSSLLESDFNSNRLTILTQDTAKIGCDKLNTETLSAADRTQHVDRTSVDREVISDLSDFEPNYYDSDILESDLDEPILIDEIRAWASTNSISMTALSSLLKILKPDHPELPADARTLMCTPRRVSLTTMNNDGMYHHFGIKNGIQKLFENLSPHVAVNNTILLQINIDGLPIFKSSRSHMWPILGKLISPPLNDVFTIGIHYGKQKPVIPEYLNAFVSESEDLQGGFYLSGHGILFNLKIHSIVCDAPARAFVKKVKSHSGYSSCERCTQVGQWDGRITFPQSSSPLRSNESFIAMSDDNHHIDNIHSPLVRLKVGMITAFPLDYMHLVCLGVMKKLLGHWMRGPIQTRLPSRSIAQISGNLVALRKFISSEFCRKPRELADFDRFKATEFRQLLLYTGPIVFKNIVSDDVYKHFMLLCVGMTCLLSNHFYLDYCDYARNLLVLFVDNAGALFGKTFLVYNVHSLVHLADDSKLYGPLDTISSFPYENYLQQIKKLVRNRNVPLQDVVNRLHEQRLMQPAQNPNYKRILSRETSGGPLPVEFCQTLQYKEHSKVTIGGFTYATSLRDSCIMYNSNGSVFSIGRIANILNISDNLVFVCRSYRNIKDFFDYPLPSSKLKIFLVADLRNTFKCIKLEDVLSKCVALPHASVVDSFVVYPLGLNC